MHLKKDLAGSANNVNSDTSANNDDPKKQREGS